MWIKFKIHRNLGTCSNQLPITSTKQGYTYVVCRVPTWPHSILQNFLAGNCDNIPPNPAISKNTNLMTAAMKH